MMTLLQIRAGIAAGAHLALRALRYRPSQSWPLALAFALGLAVTGLAFSVYEAVVLRPLPFNSDHLYMLRLYPQGDVKKWRWPSGQHYSVIRAFLPGVDVAALARGLGRGDIRTTHAALSVLRADVNPNFFRFLGVTASCDTSGRGGQSSVVVTSRLAADVFGEPLSACGHILDVDGVPYVVAGVLPPTFRWQFALPDFDAWVVAPPESLEKARQVDIIVRTSNAASVDAIVAQLNTITRELPDTDPSLRLGPVNVVDTLLGDNPAVVVTLVTIIVLAAFMAVANISALILSRARHRTHETLTRLALGARVARLRAEIIGEVWMYSVFGALLALPLLGAAIALLDDSVRAVVPSMRPLELNRRLILFFAGSAVCAGLLASGPSILALGLQKRSSLREQMAAGVQHESRSIGHLRHGIVAFQYAVVTLILTAAVVSTVHLLRLLQAPLGFRSDGVITFDLKPKGQAYRDVERAAAYFKEVVSRVRRLPFVEAATVASGFPLGGVDAKVRVAGDVDTLAANRGTEAVMRAVGVNYFETMGISMLSGRAFSEADQQRDDTLLVIVNATLASRLLDGPSSVGQSIAIGRPVGRGKMKTTVAQVVGVFRDSLTRGFAPPLPEIYVPLRVSPLLSTTLLVRLAAGVTPFDTAEIGRQVLAADPAQFVSYRDPRRLSAAVDAVLQRPRLYALVTAIVGVAVGVLALYGVFALIVYWIATRRRDVAIMCSFGASRRHVLLYVARGTVWAAVFGTAAGVWSSTFLLPVAATTLGIEIGRGIGPSLVVASSLLLVTTSVAAVPVLRSWYLSSLDILRMS